MPYVRGGDRGDVSALAECVRLRTLKFSGYARIPS